VLLPLLAHPANKSNVTGKRSFFIRLLGLQFVSHAGMDIEKYKPSRMNLFQAVSKIVNPRELSHIC
jgi:hypothetical protein